MRVLVVGAGVDREFGFRTLKNLGHTIGVIDDFSFVPTDMVDWVHGFAPSSVEDIQQVTSQSPYEWDTIVCWGEYSLPRAIEFAKVLKIPGPVLNPVAFRNKPEMRRLLALAGMRTPEYVASQDPDELEAWLTLGHGDHIVKPADYAGSSGVSLVTQLSELRPAAEAAIRKSPTGTAILEQRLYGPEYSIESISMSGHHSTVAITKKFTSSPPYFVEMGHLVPADIDDALQTAIVDEVHKALDVFGMITGASHAEVIVTENGPVVVEIAGRLGGDLIPRLVFESTGINMYELELGAITGHLPRKIRPSRDLVSAVRFYDCLPGTEIVWPATSAVRGTTLESTIRDSKHWYPYYVEAPVADGAGRRLGYCLITGSRDEVAESWDLISLLAPPSGMEIRQ